MSHGKRLILVILGAFPWGAVTSAVRADDATPIDPPKPIYAAVTDTSGPKSAPALPPICTDRPTKSYAPCTVDAGHWQVESDAINFAHQREGEVTTDTLLVTNPTVKYGVSKGLDLEVNLTPYEVVRIQKAGNPTTVLSGVGDLYLRLKYAPYASPDGLLTVAILPYLKAPTARPRLGDGALEGGSLATFSFKLSDKLILLLVPEGDDLKDSADSGRHFAASQIVNIGYILPRNLEAYAEVWADWNFDPKGLVRQESADVALQWGVTNDLQLDGGMNFGLTHETPSLQAYIGVSQRF